MLTAGGPEGGFWDHLPLGAKYLVRESETEWRAFDTKPVYRGVPGERWLRQGLLASDPRGVAVDRIVCNALNNRYPLAQFPIETTCFARPELVVADKTQSTPGGSKSDADTTTVVTATAAAGGGGITAIVNSVGAGGSGGGNVTVPALHRQRIGSRLKVRPAGAEFTHGTVLAQDDVASLVAMPSGIRSVPNTELYSERWEIYASFSTPGDSQRKWTPIWKHPFYSQMRAK